MKVSKKLIGATVALVAAASLTVGSTFAWFASRDTVGIGGVQFNVTSESESMQIAIIRTSDLAAFNTDARTLPPGVDWKYSINDGDVRYGIGRRATPSASDNSNFNIVYDQVTWDNSGSKFTDEEGTENYTYTYDDAADASNKVTNKYTRFVVVFRMDSPMSLYLNAGSAITCASGAPSNPFATYTPDAWVGTEVDNTGKNYGENLSNFKTAPVQVGARAANAARVMFDNGTDKKIWAPNEDLSAITVGSGKSVTDYTSDTAKGFYLGNLAADIKTATAASYGATLDAKSSTSAINSMRVYSMSDAATAVLSNLNKLVDANDLVKVGNYHYAAITVTVWLEGSDGDCMTSVLNDAFNYTIKFKAKG